MDWTKWQDKAASMIGKYGADVTIRATARAGYTAASDDFTTKTDTNYPAKALITYYDAKDIDGTLIQVGDREMLIPAKGLPDLEALDRVAILLGAVELNPVRIKPLTPGGTDILYRIQVRG